ncbi:hypothetical protein KY359_01680 [Candidatus Woesearchaeota archaeon]|nr:hypothetical protein [Candidatus Woesearchaeota archaeon]
MHRLEEKKGRRTVTHHFHHVTDEDGSKKHVYLGTDPSKAKDRLTKLRVERMRSDNKLIKEVEAVQAKLGKLGHYNKSYDAVVDDVRKQYYRQKHVEKLLTHEEKTNVPHSSYILIFLALAVIAGSFYVIFSEPTVTGAAVEGITKMATNQVMSTAVGMFVVIAILGIVLHAADYRHRHKHDEYKPPK